ncbi:bifunctional DNA primase/polymerase [Nocardiopsis alba]|uniref:DNA primase/polymerase bifunctional N-terminal domain-containing protein n=1 Tax=Nocardiopsis alba (strain ATCC BAA-2165 / BE74) TaxID=1205910 RepID=J7LAK4_NOCAA|nr:bifunctional DNA primase/polymerase [Nocardiopsis alba]AFR07834.1 hypothetical protein B005_0458 [Nocardiopsis alba ATCC BAA-2165]
MNNENIKKAAEAYDAAGFQVLPLNGKAAAVKGHHGREGATESVYPKGDQNLAVRLPAGVIGIDVDAHSGKDGAETLQRCIDRWGPLPETDKSTSRDGVSGILWYRVPAVGWEGDEKKFGGDIELISHVNRYAVVPPSIHPKTGDVYRWETVGDTPMWEKGPEAFPMLPARWLEGLRRTNEVGTPAKGAERHEEAITDGVPCERVEAALAKFPADLPPGSRHPRMLEVQWELVQLGAEGHQGVKTALDTLEGNFLSAVAGESRNANEWGDALDGALRRVGDVVTGDPCEENKLNLPASFWESRPSLRHIRDAAHSRIVSADVVLYTTLARMSAMVDHRTRIDTGVKSPAPLNLYVAVVGKSGAGKTSSVSVGKKLLPAPADLEGYRDGIPLGSGEGVASAFWGIDYEESRTEKNKDGSPTKVRVSKQVRHNVFFSLDEGRALNKMVERNGTTINPTLCSAFVGELIGQANASVETTRIIPEGSYSLAFQIGYQYDAAGVLLSEEASGLPQRFTWVNSTDPSIPDEDVENPGVLTGVRLQGEWGSVNGTHFSPIMHLPEDVKQEMKVREKARLKGKGEPVAELDSHQPLIRAKLSALLALLDGRGNVTHEDWELSGVMWEVSCAVREDVVQQNLEAKAEQEETATRKAVERERRLQLARNTAEPNLKRAAEAIGRQVHKSGRFTPGKLRNTLNSEQREVFKEAISHAIDAGWIVENDGAYFPGPSKP